MASSAAADWGQLYDHEKRSAALAVLSNPAFVHLLEIELERSQEMAIHGPSFDEREQSRYAVIALTNFKAVIRENARDNG